MFSVAFYCITLPDAVATMTTLRCLVTEQVVGQVHVALPSPDRGCETASGAVVWRFLHYKMYALCGVKSVFV